MQPEARALGFRQVIESLDQILPRSHALPVITGYTHTQMSGECVGAQANEDYTHGVLQAARGENELRVMIH